MSFRNAAAKMKEQLLKRHQEAIKNKDESQKSFGIFLSTEVPEGVQFWTPKKGEHLIDILPFFAGDKHPRVDKGDLCYNVDYYVHRFVGPNGITVACNKRNFNKPCYICEWIRRSKLSKEEFRQVAPKRRCAYLVWVHDSPEEEDKGIQVFDVAHYFIEENLDSISKNPKKPDGAIVFSDPDNGKSLAFEIVPSGSYKRSDGTSGEAFKYIGHRFCDRDEPIPDALLDSVMSMNLKLDRIMDMKPDYNWVKKNFLGEEEGNTAPVGKEKKEESPLMDQSRDDTQDIDLINGGEEEPPVEEEAPKEEKKGGFRRLRR